MNYIPQFLTPLVATPLPNGRDWRVVHDLKFLDAIGNLHIVRAGFVTDFASIPSLARLGSLVMLAGMMLVPLVHGLAVWLFALGFAIAWLADDLNGDDLLDGPAALHDEGYRRPRLGATAWQMKFYWDWILFTAMRANGEPLWKCWLIWYNVAAFGWFAWYQNGRKAGKGQP